MLPGDPWNAGPNGAGSPWAYMPPPPEPGTRRRWARWIVAGSIGAVIVLGLAALEGVHLIERAIQPPVPGASMVLLPDYQAGDCLYASVTLGVGPWPARQWRVPCTQPHAFEVFYADNDYWPASAPYPGREAVDEQGEAACGTRFLAYDRLPAGRTAAASEYRYVPIVPLMSEDWARGNRGLYCLAFYRAPGASWRETMLTHSIKGSGE